MQWGETFQLWIIFILILGTFLLIKLWHPYPSSALQGERKEHYTWEKGTHTALGTLFSKNQIRRIESSSNRMHRGRGLSQCISNVNKTNSVLAKTPLPGTCFWRVRPPARLGGRPSGALCHGMGACASQQVQS